MLQFQVLAQGFFAQSQLSIDYDPTYKLQLTPDEQQWADRFWAERLVQAKQQGNLLFDGSLYRFRSVSASQDQRRLHISLGDTTYKEYMVTRQPVFAQDRPLSELGCPLAGCAVIETSDDVILLDLRQGMDVGNGLYHVIGGIIERGRDTVIDSQTGKPTANPFGSIRRELYEETGIREDDIADQHSFGLVYDLENPHAEILFLIRLRISISEVRQRTPQDNEVKQLHTLQVTPESLRDFILQHHGHALSTTGEPNLLLYGGWKFGSDWYRTTLAHIK